VSTVLEPYVGLAVLCDRVAVRDDGAVDVFGIVDGVMLEPEGSDALGLRPSGTIELTLLVNVRAGSDRQRHTLSVAGVYPSGRAGQAITREVEFTDELPGAWLEMPLELEVHEPGIYHFDVACDGHVLTRIPLHVVYKPPFVPS
jgi:hypothetical protein